MQFIHKVKNVPFVLKAVFNQLKSTMINKQMGYLTNIFHKSFYEKKENIILCVSIEL